MESFSCRTYHQLHIISLHLELQFPTRSAPVEFGVHALADGVPTQGDSVGPNRKGWHHG